MTVYSKAPHWVVIPYTVSNLTHKLSLSLDIQDDTLGLGSYNIYDGISATYTSFDTWINGFLTEFATLLDASTSGIGNPTLYRQLPTDQTPKVLDTYNHSIPASGVGGNTLGVQATLRYRDLEGNIIRIQVYEGLISANQRLTYLEAPTNWQDFHTYVFQTTNCIYSSAGLINNGGFSLTTCFNNSLTRKRFSVG